MNEKDILNNLTQGILILDKDFNIVNFNKKFVEIFSFDPSQFNQNKCFQILKNSENKCDNCPIIKKNFNSILHQEYRNISIDVKVSPIENENYLIEIFNIDEILKLFEKKIEERKFAEAGHISASIAHEVNNILMVIIGKIETLNLLRLNNKLTEKRLEDALKTIEEKSNQIKELMNEILTFSHPERLRKVKKNISQLIKEFYIFSKYEIERPGVIFSIELEDTPEIEIEENLFTLMLLNICKILSRNFYKSNLEDKKIEIKTFSKDNKIFLMIKDNNTVKSEELEKILENISNLSYENFIIRYSLIYHGAKLEYKFTDKGNNITIIFENE